ncbi:MAG TPA: GNAT family N-acetyltransferase [Streptosporangiaceae bacterium]|nr:GNAT family N-acetyltransferase [Streptosporangiaceae bacterium]
MSWRMTESVEEFAAEAGEFLRAERARNTVLLTVTQTLRGRPDTYRGAGRGGPVFGWWLSTGAGGPGAGGRGVGAAFMQTPPHPPLLTAMTDAAAAALAHELADAGREIPGVNTPEEAARAFAAAWRERTGTPASVHVRMRLFRLGDLIWPSPMPEGRARLAGTGDRDLLIAWFGAFAAEAGAMGESDQGQAVDDRLSYRGATIWEAGGVPVALACTTRTVAGMVRVGPVYTPPELRGRGYAGAATAAVSQAARDAGTAEVLLYTDLANLTSNALYQRLGYRPVEDRVLLEFG